VEWTASLWTRSADGEPVVVRLAPPNLIIVRSNGDQLTAPIRHLRPTRASVSGGGVRLEWNHSVLVVRDESILGALGAPPRHLGLGIFGVVGISFLLLLGGIYAGWQWLLPGAAAALARQVPLSWERELGRSVVAPYRLRPAPCPDAQRASEAIVERLRRGIQPQHYEFHLQVIDDPTVNALAAPGGHLVVFRGLIDRTATPEELAAVLAHEMAHLLERHSLQVIFRSTAWWAILALLTGDPSGLATVAAASLGQLHFQRQHEQQADQLAMLLLERAAIDPHAMAAIFRKLEESAAGSLPPYLSTHPPIDNRVRLAEAWARAARYPTQPLLVSEPWPPSWQCR
jgi:predicted Zn-dependent protease